MGPATMIPMRTPKPQPRLMESMLPFSLLLRTAWATQPQPNIMRTAVPNSSAVNSFRILNCDRVIGGFILNQSVRNWRTQKNR